MVVRINKIVLILVANMSISLLAGCMPGSLSCYHAYSRSPDTFTLLPHHRCLSPDCIRKKDLLAQNLFSHHRVKVYHVGHSRLISFSTDELFNGRSANFNRCAFSLLKAVAEYIKHDDMEVIEVGAYTDSLGAPHLDRLISTQRADKIVHYLTDAGVPANLIYAVGWGQAAPLSNNTTYQGQRFNRRIELRYRVLDTD